MPVDDLEIVIYLRIVSILAKISISSQYSSTVVSKTEEECNGPRRSMMCKALFQIVFFLKNCIHVSHFSATTARPNTSIFGKSILEAVKIKKRSKTYTSLQVKIVRGRSIAYPGRDKWKRISQQTAISGHSKKKTKQSS